MRKFRFRLESVLAERKRWEDLKLREWTLAKRIVEAMKGDRALLDTRLKGAIEEATSLGSAGTGWLAVMDDFIRGTRLRIEWKCQDIARAEKLTEKKRLEFVAASQKRKALEKLRERNLTEFRARARKAELKALDDIYIMRDPAGHARLEEGEE